MAGAHHRGSYAARARKLRAAANADPLTRCWRCGRTLAEVPGSTWDAGHYLDNPNGELYAEHSTCNRSAGATLGNQRRTQGTTRRW
jgi:hypothetical protein